MIRLFKHYLPRPLLILGLVEVGLIFLSAVLGWELRLAQIGAGDRSVAGRLPELIAYTVTVYIVMLGVGSYQLSSFRSIRMTGARLILAMLLSIVVLSIVLLFIPTLNVWRSALLYAIVIALALLMGVRLLFLSAIGWQRFREPVLVIGSGEQGRQLSEVAQLDTAGFRIVEHLSLRGGGAVADARPFTEISSLASYCDKHVVEEIVLALDERRGFLPSKQLLEAKLSGVRVTDKTTFLERMTGRVDLSSLNPSWLIFSDGFLGSSTFALMSKRFFDVSTSLLLLILSSPILLAAAAAIKLTSPGPVFYRQERVGQFGRVFRITKFRSMGVDAEQGGAQWAQAQDPRVTPVGRILRATRIDEIPQIINVLKGDMSFVGPRPERPVFVEELARDIPFYNERHVVKPGITGWAQLNYPYGASLEDARHKLEYDLYYIKNYSLFLDLAILIQTARVVIWQDGVR